MKPQIYTFIPALMLSFFFNGACSDDPKESYGTHFASPKLLEIERTLNNSGDITIYRTILTYEKDEVQEIQFFRNGEKDGHAVLQWNKSSVENITLVDVDGDKATETWSYDNGRPISNSYIVPQLRSSQTDFEYDDAEDGREKQITTVFNSPSFAGSKTVYKALRYEDNGLLKEVNTIEDADNEVYELRYDSEDRLSRGTKYKNGAHLRTFELQYNKNGRVEEIERSDNVRFLIEYDSSNRIEVIKTLGLSSGGMSTVRYKYGEGSMSGFSVAPELPLHDFLDLRGESQGRISFLHFFLRSPDDIPRVSGSRGSGGSGSGGSGSGGSSGSSGGACSGLADETSCDICLNAQCCAPLRQCQDSPKCVDYFRCVDACTNSACQQDCKTASPQGSLLLEAFNRCASNNCQSECA